MAELPADGKMHEVDNAEADDVIEAASHQILPNEAIGRVIRNMYKRIQTLEAEVKDLKGKKAKKAAPVSGGS
ncbi:MAG: hypothetical protein NWF01_07805 [Candidatus Bathyarchaeota archaeon]|nr:hypothetical protein [Candidatus Bathyarchaeota archaeon]